MISIRKHSGVYTLTSQQWLPLSLEQAWEFFSRPDNLPEITPPRMGFRITSLPSEQVYAGQIITYKVSIFPMIRSNWVTEITHVSEGRSFIDEQRSGPYRIWHHEHRFESKDDGVLMTDKVTYKLPLGFLGRLFHGLLVKPSLLGIFKYRSEQLPGLLEKIRN